MSFDNIPAELKAYRQWILWRLEERDGKPTKVPYQTNGEKASVTNPSHWANFDNVIEVYLRGLFDGIGFVLTKDDPYSFIDLDDTHGDATALERQRKVYREFNSYSELSPSGNGLHIIVKGSVAHGR